MTAKFSQELDSILGDAVTIRNHKFNKSIRNLFPVTGIIEKRLCSERANDWYLVRLDKPFIYLRGEHSHILIRSSAGGQSISYAEECAVFFILIPDMTSVMSDVIEDIEDLSHIAFGIVECVSNTLIN